MKGWDLYKYSILLLGVLTTLDASYDAYGVNPSDETLYFVKIGAYTQESNALAKQHAATIPTHIRNLGKYYSVLSSGSPDLAKTKGLLRKLKSTYKDAYIISLSKQPEVITKPDPVTIKAPQRELSAYEKGVRFYHDKHYEEALVFFDRVLIDDEEDINALMFYAKTLYLLEIKDEAKKSFETLLTKALSSKQTEEVKRYLKSIESQEKKHFFKTTLSIGVGYDDNVNLTTDSKTTTYGPLTLINDTNKTNSTFGIASLTLAHRYKAESFDVISTLYSYNELLHSAKGNDLNYVDFSTGVRKHLGDWTLWLPLGANISYLDGENVGHNFYTSPAISYHLNKQWTSTLQATYLDNTSSYMRVKDYIMMSSTWGLRYQQMHFMFGGGVGYQDLSLKKSYRYDMDKKALNSHLFGRYTFSKSQFIAGNIAYVKDDYDYADPTMGYAREDKILHFGLSFGQKIGENTLLQLGLMRVENDSNVNAYAYKKNSYKLQYNYTF